MTPPKHLALLLIFAAAACGEPGSNPPPTGGASDAATPSAASIPLDPADGAVLPDEAAAQLQRQCSRLSPGPVISTWQPDADSIAGLESRLGAELARQLAAKSQTAAPADYYRQYAGFIIGGRRVIYVNGIQAVAADRSGQDWRKEAALICDGGTITFGVEYDPATQAFSNFAFNGPF